MKYEHLVIHHPIDRLELLESVLDGNGNDGWKLISVIKLKTTFVLIFGRKCP